MIPGQSELWEEKRWHCQADAEEARHAGEVKPTTLVATHR